MRLRQIQQGHGREACLPARPWGLICSSPEGGKPNLVPSNLGQVGLDIVNVIGDDDHYLQKTTKLQGLTGGKCCMGAKGEPALLTHLRPQQLPSLRAGRQEQPPGNGPRPDGMIPQGSPLLCGRRMCLIVYHYCNRRSLPPPNPPPPPPGPFPPEIPPPSPHRSTIATHLGPQQLTSLRAGRQEQPPGYGPRQDGMIPRPSPPVLISQSTNFLYAGRQELPPGPCPRSDSMIPFPRVLSQLSFDMYQPNMPDSCLSLQ